MPATKRAARKQEGSSLFPPWMESAQASRADVDTTANGGAPVQKPNQASQPSPAGGGRKVGKSRRRHADKDVAEKSSSCVEPDHLALLRSISSVLTRRIRDNDEHSHGQITHPLFCEDTHTEEPAEDLFDVILPTMHMQALSFPTLFTLKKLRPPPRPPPSYPVPSMRTVNDFIENIWHRARLTPQSLVICLVYIDRLEARSEGAILHARSWRPIIFASLLLASKVWHDVSYWNSDFSTICPMFTTRNINQMERAYLQLLQYNTIISASQYASYYFSLRTAALQQPATPGGGETGGGTARRAAGRGGDNFRRKYFMTLNVPSASKIEQKTLAVAGALVSAQEDAGGVRPAPGTDGSAATAGSAGAPAPVTAVGASKEVRIKRTHVSKIEDHGFDGLPSMDSPGDTVAASYGTYGAGDKPTTARAQGDALGQYLSMSLCIM